MTDDDEKLPAATVEKQVADRPAELPIVARLVVEIRSDGRRTIARGALQDAALGQEVAVRAEGTTPFALALSLASSLFRTPILGRVLQRALGPRPSSRPSSRPRAAPPKKPPR